MAELPKDKPLVCSAFLFGIRTITRQKKNNHEDQHVQKDTVIWNEDIEALGLKVVEVKTPVEIIPGGYFTGGAQAR
jgi:hypothetical protein